MDEIAIGVRAAPARKSIRAEPRMHHRNGGFYRLIGKIRIKRHELPGRQHSLVDNRPAGQAGNIKEIPSRQSGIADRVFRAAANHIELALESQVVFDGFSASDKNLAHKRFASLCRITEIQVIRGDLAPAEKLLPFLGNDLFKNFFKLTTLLAIIRQEDHADAIFSGISQVKTQPRTGILKKRMRDLYEYPDAIASIFFATASATVIEILQDCQCLLDDFA